MTTEKKQAVKEAVKRIGKTVWSELPWVLMSIGLTCLFMLPLLYADENAEMETQIAVLEAKNEIHESENTRLDEEIEWLRSLIEQEVGNGQIQP